MRSRMHCRQCTSRPSALRLFLENCSGVLKAPQFVQCLISCCVPGPWTGTELSNGRLIVLIAVSIKHYRTYVLYDLSFIGARGKGRSAVGWQSMNPGARGSSGWAGVRGGALRQTVAAPQRAPIPERSVGAPRRGRVRSQEGAADQARGGIGCQPVSPRSGARSAACGQGGNAPGCSSPPGVREHARHRAQRPAVIPWGRVGETAEAMVTVWALWDRRTENFPGDHGANAPNAGLANSPLSLVGCANALATLGAEDQSRTDDTCIFSAVLYH